MQVIMNKVELIVLSDVISLYLSWSSTNSMSCNLSKCEEFNLVLKKKGLANPRLTGNIKEAEFLVEHGVTFQRTGRITEHIKRKLLEANNISASTC